MELKIFNKNELLKNLQIIRSDTNRKVTLYNEYVEILLDISDIMDFKKWWEEKKLESHDVHSIFY